MLLGRCMRCCRKDICMPPPLCGYLTNGNDPGLKHPSYSGRLIATYTCLKSICSTVMRRPYWWYYGHDDSPVAATRRTGRVSLRLYNSSFEVGLTSTHECFTRVSGITMPRPDKMYCDSSGSPSGATQQRGWIRPAFDDLSLNGLITDSICY